MDNYFNYFTEIEEKFQRRRDSALLLSTLDWALIASWKEADIPLQAVLAGIDAAFDRYDRRPPRSRKVNSLAYCAQEVLAAAEDMKEAAVGAQRGAAAPRPGLFSSDEIAAYLERNAGQLESAKLAGAPGARGQELLKGTSGSLRALAAELKAAPLNPRLEELEGRLTVLEEKLYGGLLAATADEEVLAMRTQADHELAPYRRTMTGAQIEQLQKQYLRKRLLEKHGLPRLSLFYL